MLARHEDRALSPPRVDHLLIAEMVKPGARVLDVGCGDGALLQLLADRKNVDGRGVDELLISHPHVAAGHERGRLGDADQVQHYLAFAVFHRLRSLWWEKSLRPAMILVSF